MFQTYFYNRKEWLTDYPAEVRTLDVYSADPLLIYPTYYESDKEFVSDTSKAAAAIM